MAGPAEGLTRFTLFANEEANDIVPVPEGAPYGADPAVAPNRQAGYAVALDVGSGEFTQIAGLGRLNHENTVVIPGGWSRHALLTTDDTFSAPSAQLYLYLASQETHIWQDKGSLWAFRVTRTDEGPIDAKCLCPACRNHSRGYLRHLIQTGENLGSRLTALHNLTYYLNLLTRARRAIEIGAFSALHAEIEEIADRRL